MNRAARLAPLVVAALLAIRALARRGRHPAEVPTGPATVSAATGSAGVDSFPSAPGRSVAGESPPAVVNPPPAACGVSSATVGPRPAADPPPAVADLPPAAVGPRLAVVDPTSAADPPPPAADSPPAVADLPPVRADTPPEVAPRRQAPSRRAVALSLSALRWTALGVVVGLVGALAGAKGFGYETMTVMSGSMEPRIHTGDVVVAKPIEHPTRASGMSSPSKSPMGRGA